MSNGGASCCSRSRSRESSSQGRSAFRNGETRRNTQGGASCRRILRVLRVLRLHSLVADGEERRRARARRAHRAGHGKGSASHVSSHYFHPAERPRSATLQYSLQSRGKEKRSESVRLGRMRGGIAKVYSNVRICGTRIILPPRGKESMKINKIEENG